TDGEVFIDNKAVHFNSIFDSIEYGIIKVHQEINIVPELTVWENLMLGKEITKGLFLNSAQMIKETQDILDALSCDFSAKEKIKNLGTGQTQMVQIAKA
ncbi:MAG: ATP-binding cassette domain-containing protein, partial [Christensenellaceae bacterium]